MRLQIVYLDPNDDHHSAREKLGWIKSTRALLVWPARGDVLQRRLDLQLIKRKASRQGIQLGLLTHDLHVRATAAELSIPVFDDLDHLPEDRWRIWRPRSAVSSGRFRRNRDGQTRLPPRPKRAGDGVPAVRGWRWALLPFVLLSYLSLIAAILPSAQVRIDPRTSTRSLELTLVLNPEAEEPTSTGMIPVRLERIRVSGDLRRPTSGSLEFPTQPAKGRVDFVNLSQTAVLIPKGTGVRSTQHPGVRFITDESLSLEPGEAEAASVGVTAAEPGPTANLPAEALDEVEGPLGLQVSVRNPEPLSGGSEARGPGVSRKDREQLAAALEARLAEDAAKILADTLSPGEVLVGGHLQISREYERRFEREIGQAAPTHSAFMDLEFVGQIYRTADVESAAEKALAAARPPGWSEVPGSLGTRLTSEPQINAQGAITFTLFAQSEGFRDLSQSEISQRIRGLRPTEVQSLLERAFGVQLSSLRLTPGWLPRLPLFEFRIDVGWSWER